MASEDLQVVQLRDDFYRDGFYKALSTLLLFAVMITLLVGMIVYLYGSKPKPIYFAVDDDLRILAPVPVSQAYLTTADLIQWVSTVIPASFTFDFVNYSKQLQNLKKYFTSDGWSKLQDHLNNFANANLISTNKLFVNAQASGAPFILNQGVLQNRYAWWVQMPITITYSTFERNTLQNITVQVLVVRIPTDNNLDGVAIDNIIISKASGNALQT